MDPRSRLGWRPSLMMCVVGLVWGGSAIWAQLPMRPGSLVTIAGFGDSQLIELSQEGEVLGHVAVPGLGTAVDLTQHEGSLWVANGTTVFRLDVATGALSDGFVAADGNGLTALCSDGTHLWAGEFTTGQFRRFDSLGTLLETITLDTANLFTAGADCDAEHLYVASHATGNVHVFDLTGATVRVIGTDQFSDLSGVVVAPDDQTLWVVTGIGINELIQFDIAGNLLATFEGPPEAMMGIHTLDTALFVDGFESGDLSAWTTTVP